MGRVKHIILKREIPKSVLNNRFTCELCENIHIHYRNIRLEFSKQEFLLILQLLKSIEEKEIARWETGNYVYKELINENTLPDDTEFDSRLQIELQEEGHYHIHYRNLRIELNNLYEFGFPKDFKQKDLFDVERGKRKLLVRNISRMRYAVNFNELIEKDDIFIDEDILSFFSDKSDYRFIKDKVCVGDLLGTMLLKDGKQWHYYNITELPEYKFLFGDEKGYIEYINFINKFTSFQKHSVSKFKNLIESLDKHGYNKKNIIFVDIQNNILAGKHRASWLYKKYGGDFKIDVIRVNANSMQRLVPLKFIYKPKKFSKLLIQFLSCFIPNKEKRLRFRQKYVRR